MPDHEALPLWDLTSIFPSLESPQYQDERAALSDAVASLEARFDELGINKGGSASPTHLSEILDMVNGLGDRLEVVSAYIGCLVTTDTRDEAALAAESELDNLLAQFRKLLKRLTGWLGGMDTEAVASDPTASAHRYTIERARIGAEHLMTADLESLASDMEVTGGVAWAKLYGQITSQLELELDGERHPVSAVRALASDPDRAVRRRAYEAELAAWKTVEVPIAAALNGIKGETILLSRRRGWTPLEAACFGASIDPATLEAMLTAARESLPTFRRYWRAKARAIGVDRLAFYDIFAPVGQESAHWPYAQAEQFVADQFRTYSDKLADFALRTYRERWIDAGPRPGKVDGAYCTPIRADESRILMNFKSTFDSVRTLAHELGHAYHNVCLNGRTSLQRETPMTLAETASIFCETIVKNGVLSNGSPNEKMVALEASLQGAGQVVVDIMSRFQFESAVFDLRAKREANPRELCDLMRQAQLDTYGDGLDPEQLHPYMWAAKGHYYGASFYNFPYMFGLLFGLGLYDVYRREGDSFRTRYDELLSSTGLADAAKLADGFGINIRTPDFWRGSLAQIARDVDEFERLVGA